MTDLLVRLHDSPLTCDLTLLYRILFLFYSIPPFIVGRAVSNATQKDEEKEEAKKRRKQKKKPAVVGWLEKAVGKGKEKWKGVAGLAV